MGRSHDFYCHTCECHWSPLDFHVCPGCGTDENSEYDLNCELGQDNEEDHGEGQG